VARTEERQDPQNKLKEMCLDSAEESGEGLEWKGLEEETVQRARERESERARERARARKRERLLLGTIIPQRGVQGHVIPTSGV
jgi:hypothetical protein